MQTILYISDNYCTSLDELKHFLELGVNDKSIRNEIMSYYRDGVLTEWINSFLPNFSCSINEASDNVVYDALYTQLTGKGSVKSSLSSSFSDYVKIEGLRYSKDTTSYENLNGAVSDIKSIIIAIKVLQPENNDFVLKAKSNDETLWEYKLNLKNYKRNQKFELFVDLKKTCTNNIQLIEGANNVLYETVVYKAQLPESVKDIIERMFECYNPSDRKIKTADDYYKQVNDWGMLRNKNSEEQEFIKYVSQSLAILTFLYSHAANWKFLEEINNTIVSEKHCMVCLKAILIAWNIEINGYNIAKEYLEKSKDYRYSKQLLKHEFKGERNLEANDGNCFPIYIGTRPQYKELKNFLKWYFLHVEFY